ncbi:hypothetical protein KO500_09345 [Cellulophaga baltica]|uniref:hypothetical protein n=1 Tax=Cellulophaga TaxID=104264 RepID=UPI001C072EC2|nr:MULTISPECIES: hypothetical protein [Cellulophaga]MBU2996640.1 hypothetical protein [Cellulophaga baltica]MDO6768034.1 hypothetical protein [Cellulophaga sp. 1_MG-2023]
MSVIIEFKNCDNYLYAEIEAAWTKENAFLILDAIKVEADAQGYNLILINARGMSLPDNEMIRYYTGEIIASLFKSHKLTIYLQAEKINKFAENVAVNRGATVYICDNKADAINWLLS